MVHSRVYWQILLIGLKATHIDHPCCVTLFEVKQHSWFMEEGQHGHVLDLVELWRILLQNLGVFDSHSLKEMNAVLCWICNGHMYTFHREMFILRGSKPNNQTVSGTRLSTTLLVQHYKSCHTLLLPDGSNASFHHSAAHSRDWRHCNCSHTQAPIHTHLRINALNHT